MQKHLPPNLKLVLDFAPLAVFFIAYKLSGVMAATAALIVATALTLAAIYYVERKIALAPLITGVVVALFGGLTLVLKNDDFIKIKPTIINLIFSLTLLIGVYGFKRGLLKPVLGMTLEITDKGWCILSARWGFFFLFLAALNEFIWRNFPTEFWVNFKVFGMFTLTILFAVSQYRLIQRHST
jgi:intracellular septation protein